MAGIPTKFPIKHRCGHSPLIDLANNTKQPKLNRGPTKREGFANWLSQKWSDPEEGRDCFKCFKEKNSVDKEQFKRQLMLDVSDFEERYALPELQGKPKMIESGLVESARKDRYTVLSVLFDQDESEHLDKHGTLLDVSRMLTWAGFWTDNLGFKVRKEREYGQDEFVEMLLDGAKEEEKRLANQSENQRIETENPYE